MTTQACKFYYNCVNPVCPFQHPKVKITDLSFQITKYLFMKLFILSNFRYVVLIDFAQIKTALFRILRLLMYQLYLKINWSGPDLKIPTSKRNQTTKRVHSDINEFLYNVIRVLYYFFFMRLDMHLVDISIFHFWRVVSKKYDWLYYTDMIVNKLVIHNFIRICKILSFTLYQSLRLYIEYKQ